MDQSLRGFNISSASAFDRRPCPPDGKFNLACIIGVNRWCQTFHRYTSVIYLNKEVFNVNSSFPRANGSEQKVNEV